MKKKCIVAMIFFVLVTCVLPVNAAKLKDESSSEDISVHIDFLKIKQFKNEFSISNSGMASVYSSVLIDDIYTGRVEVILQQYKSGSWNNVKTWTNQSTGKTVVTYNYKVTKGYSYRMISNCSVYSGNIVLENSSYTSSTVVY